MRHLLVVVVRDVPAEALRNIIAWRCGADVNVTIRVVNEKTSCVELSGQVDAVGTARLDVCALNGTMVGGGQIERVMTPEEFDNETARTPFGFGAQPALSSSANRKLPATAVPFGFPYHSLTSSASAPPNFPFPSTNSAPPQPISFGFPGSATTTTTTTTTPAVLGPPTFSVPTTAPPQREAKFGFAQTQSPIIVERLDINASPDRILRAIKAMLLNGRDLCMLVGPQDLSLFELVATAVSLPTVEVVDFMLEQGAPIVVIDQKGKRHDGFVAIASRRRADGDVRVAILERFLECGYEISGDAAATILRALRSVDDVTTRPWLVQRLAARNSKLVVPADHFRIATVSALIEELDLIDVVASRAALESVLSQVLSGTQVPDAALLRRLLALPGAELKLVEAASFSRLPNLVQAVVAEVRGAVWTEWRIKCTALNVLQHDGGVSLLTGVLNLGPISDINELINSGSLLSTACKRGASVAVINLLLARGADVNARDSDGNTPLHQSRDVATDELLVRAGADLTLRNNNGHTPRDTLMTSGTRDTNRVWFFERTVPAIKSREAHSALLEVCIAIAPLLHDVPPEIIDKIVALLPNMHWLGERARMSLALRVGAAHSQKLAGGSVGLAPRRAAPKRRPIVEMHLPAPDFSMTARQVAQALQPGGFVSMFVALPAQAPPSTARTVLAVAARATVEQLQTMASLGVFDAMLGLLESDDSELAEIAIDFFALVWKSGMRPQAVLDAMSHLVDKTRSVAAANKARAFLEAWP